MGVGKFRSCQGFKAVRVQKLSEGLRDVMGASRSCQGFRDVGVLGMSERSRVCCVVGMWSRSCWGSESCWGTPEAVGVSELSESKSCHWVGGIQKMSGGFGAVKVSEL